MRVCLTKIPDGGPRPNNEESLLATALPMLLLFSGTGYYVINNSVCGFLGWCVCGGELRDRFML